MAPIAPRRSIKLLALRYGTAIFLSAFLLFQVQPLIANTILPWFGGTSLVWTTCLLFFQVLLVAGYAYAHFLSRLALHHQARLHLAILLGSVLLLPITPSESWKPSGGDSPLPGILALLAVSVGIPYLILSTTGPLLQSWFARESRVTSPYRLFALSNAASLLGLATYPFLVKPALAVGSQTVWWSVGYVAFVFTCGWCAVLLIRRPVARTDVPSVEMEDTRRPGWSTYFFWVALPATASLLLLGITNKLTSAVAAVPLLWVLPLVIYLLTFILNFERPAWYTRRFYAPFLGVSLLANTMLISLLVTPHWIYHLIIASITLFVCSMVCHGELVRLRPHPRHLTAFYLSVAIGGAIGGAFVAVFAPLVFTGFWEVPLGLLACLLLLLARVHQDPGSRLRGGRPRAAWQWIAVGVGVIGPAMMAEPLISMWQYDIQVRNFYGVHQLLDRDRDTPRARRILHHGITMHGTQYLSDELRHRPLAYYGSGSGIALAIEQHPRRLGSEPIRIGVVGLGAGTLAAYGRAGDKITFYELDPQVERLAREYFTFLRDSPAEVEVVLGDGRLSLERATTEDLLDILAVDAFAGGSIPMHLLTRECFAIYGRALKPDGVLAIHVSNKYLHLAPVVRSGAATLGMQAIQVSSDGNPDEACESSHWVLATRNSAFFEATSLREAATPWEQGDEPIAWSDQKSSLLQVLR